ncbi:hypothetical protein [uncultured Brevundimonas sp.]|uniref:hypothetical protein n=1 Tax=uncultured Brevundimonas sp. TaxID=213418 RepID=UPI0026262EC6|nr:hypothetical protein [uncultured Brevundimonas sp.]
MMIADLTGRLLRRESLPPPVRSAGLALILLTTATTPAIAQADRRPSASEIAPQVRLMDDVVTLPITMIREYPFVDASIAGVAGKLMLDTGYEPALMVNDHRVPMSGGRSVGIGSFGSGQTFEVRIVPEVSDVRVGDLSFPRVTEVRTQDARLLETITPDFLGWLGYNAFATHALKLDYGALQATFYRSGGADFLAGERVVARLAFSTRRLPNHPMTPARLGEMSILAAWDTGQYGDLYTTEEGKARLLSEGRLTPSQTDPDTFDLHGLTVDGHPMPVLSGISVQTDPSPSAGPVGLTESDHLTLGYNLLQHFKTVWDFPQRHIYLLAPGLTSIP